MCGRASQAEIRSYQEKIYKWLHPEAFEPRRNLRPTEPAWIVARHPDNEIKTVQGRWWCQWDGSYTWEAKYPTFNARVDTMHDKKLWPELLEKGKRCILPVDSFYEWPIKGKKLPPVEIFLEGKEPMAIAGLWSTWYDNRQARYSFTTFTTRPNQFMKPLHPDAMPVILNGIDEQ